MFRKKFIRSKVSLVDCSGYVDLHSACVRANQTGFFALNQRVNPESFDGKDTNIDPRDCFFGGRRIDLALQCKHAEDFANKSRESAPNAPNDGGDGTPSGQSE